MAYADQTAMEKRFKGLELIELTNQDDPHAETINAAELQVALDDASAEIDAMLGSRYPVPLDPAPAVIERLCCDIARYLLFSGKAPEEVQKRYDDAHKLLKRMASGDVVLGSEVAANNTGPTFQAHKLAFNEKELFS